MGLDSTFAIGVVECIASTVLYGSAFVPIKKRKFGDGIYSLQIRSIGILMVGLVTYIIADYPPFYLVAMIGGMLWAIANIIVLPCIGQLGLGMTVLLYSTTNCLTNWFTGNFGLFWTNARPPHTHWMNYLGLMSLLIGGILIAFIRPEAQKQARDVSPTESIIGIVSEKPESVIIDGFKPAELPAITSDVIRKFNFKRILAIVFALISGFFYGEDVTPVIYIQDRYEGAPQDGLSYCFSHYFGVFLTASLVFMVYCVVKKNKPYINDELTFPSFISGLIWGIAQTLFMMSIKILSQSIAGAIGAIFPACTASVWAVFYFKEIKGRKNYIMLSLSILVTSIGAVLISVSKEI